MNNQINASNLNNVRSINKFMSQVYLWMIFAVIIFFGTAQVAASKQIFINGMTALIAFVVEMIIMLGIGKIAQKQPMFAVAGLAIFAFINGLLVAGIFAITEPRVLLEAGISASGIFVVMAGIGLTTKIDVNKWRTKMLVALIVLIIAEIIEMFIGSSTFAMILSGFVIIVFSIMTMLDSKQIKDLYLQNGDQISTTGLAAIGALNLFLDFINILMSLIQIFNRN